MTTVYGGFEMESQIIYTVLTGAVLSLFILFNYSLRLRIKVLFWLAIFMVIVLLPISYYEQMAAAGKFSVEIRTVLSAVAYALKVWTAYFMFAVLSEHRLRHEWQWMIPGIINTVICLLTIKTGWVFVITADNVFVHGPLYYMPMIVATLYLAATLRRTVRQLSRQPLYEVWLGLAVGLQIFVAFALVMIDHCFELFNYTIPTTFVFYYTWVAVMQSKLDALTGALNRYSYEMDAKHFAKKKCGIIAIDMNDLKEINDSWGHLAGDNALKDLADVTYRYLPFAVKLYRLGGDEFVVLWPNVEEDRLLTLVEKLRVGLRQLPHGAAVGCYLKTDGNESIEEAMNKADQAMYQDKHKKQAD